MTVVLCMGVETLWSNVELLLKSRLTASVPFQMLYLCKFFCVSCISTGQNTYIASHYVRFFAFMVYVVPLLLPSTKKYSNMVESV